MHTMDMDCALHMYMSDPHLSLNSREHEKVAREIEDFLNLRSSRSQKDNNDDESSESEKETSDSNDKKNK